MWLSINDKYEINVSGEVRNKTTQLILKPWVIGQKPYYYHAVWIGKKRCRIHHLVASRFLPAPTEENLVIDHIDRNRQNNHASNLRWVNYSVNATNRTILIPARENHHIMIRECESNIDYIVKIIINKKLHYKVCKTLKQAKYYRDYIINNSEYKRNILKL
jgi:hypothetical protein